MLTQAYVREAGAWAQVHGPLSTGVGYVAGWGLPSWQDEPADRLAWKAANPGIHEVDPANWNVRDRSGEGGANGSWGLNFDAGEPKWPQVEVDSAGILRLVGNWKPDAPVSRTPSSAGVDVLTHNGPYMDQRVVHAGDSAPIATRYGRWAARMRVPTGPNTYGAHVGFWLRNTSSAEIDIMEAWGQQPTMPADYTTYVEGRSTFTTYTNTSTGADKKFWRYEEELGLSQAADPVYGDWHEWALEWTEDYWAILYDGVVAQRVDRGVNFTDATGTTYNGDHYWDHANYNTPYHVRLNMHIGSGTYWGVPDPNNQQWTVDPLVFEVDYVRVWAL